VNPFVKEVLSEVADWTGGEGMRYVSLNARDPRFWAAMVIFAILLFPTLIAAEIVNQLVG